jgi:hypothetical protein
MARLAPISRNNSKVEKPARGGESRERVPEIVDAPGPKLGERHWRDLVLCEVLVDELGEPESGP